MTYRDSIRGFTQKICEKIEENCEKQNRVSISKNFIKPKVNFFSLKKYHSKWEKIECP